MKKLKGSFDAEYESCACEERTFRDKLSEKVEAVKSTIGDFKNRHTFAIGFLVTIVLVIACFFAFTSTYTLNATIVNVGYGGVTVTFPGMYESDNEQQLTMNVNNPSEYQVGDIVTIEIRVENLDRAVMYGKICTPPNTMASIGIITDVAVVEPSVEPVN